MTKKIIEIKNYDGVITDIAYEGTNTRVSICALRMEGIRTVLEYGVNWSACGTKTAKEAKEYTELMKRAITVVEKLNKSLNK